MLNVVSGALVFLFFVGLSVVDAYAVRDLWRWFAVPTLGAPAISALQAYGLNLLVIAFTRKPVYPPDDPKKVLRASAVYALGILMTWAIGYVVHLYL